MGLGTGRLARWPSFLGRGPWMKLETPDPVYLTERVRFTHWDHTRKFHLTMFYQANRFLLMSTSFGGEWWWRQ